MNKSWLMEVANPIIKHNLGHKIKKFSDFLENEEVRNWFFRLEERVNERTIGDVHGSHDYRMENILGKCFVLGLTKEYEQFAECMSFITDYLQQCLKEEPGIELNYAKLYHYRDYQKVLCCYLPFLGYGDDSAVQYIGKQRIERCYMFTKEKCYDIYDTESHFFGVKKDWRPYIIKPSLYADGHIPLPDIHDLILFAGMYPQLSKSEKEKVESIVAWLFDEGYQKIIRRYGYFYVPGDIYSAKAIISKPYFVDFQYMDAENVDKGDLTSLVFQLFILSHFETARNTLWFQLAMDYLETFRCKNGHYKFPAYLITEKQDCYVTKGGHMNVGENKKNILYREILSTYWMEKISVKDKENKIV